MSFDNENKNTQEPTFQITKDNLLHCLMHTATRENIAELRAENKADVLRLSDKLDSKASKADVDKISDKLDTKASRADVDKLNDKIESIADKIDKKLNRYFMWLVGLMFGSFGGIAIMILKFSIFTH